MFNKENFLESEVRELKQKIIKLEQRETEINLGVLELFEISKLSDDEVYEKFKYKQWKDLHKLTRNYICDRFGIEILQITNLRLIVRPDRITVREEECIGKSLDIIRKFDKLKTQELKCPTIKTKGYYVYNPNKNKPKQIYQLYTDAYEEAKRIAELEPCSINKDNENYIEILEIKEKIKCSGCPF